MAEKETPKPKSYKEAWRTAHNLLAKERGDYEAALATLSQAADAEEFLATNAAIIQKQQLALGDLEAKVTQAKHDLSVAEQTHRTELNQHNATLREKRAVLQQVEGQTTKARQEYQLTTESLNSEISQLTRNKTTLKQENAQLEREKSVKSAELTSLLQRIEKASAMLAG